MNVGLGTFASNCDYVSSSEQGMRKMYSNIGSKIRVTFSIAVTLYDSADPNVSVVHSSYECGP